MIKRYILPVILLILLGAGLLLGHHFWVAKDVEEPESLQLSTQKADDDFTNLFRLTDTRGHLLTAVTVTSVEEVTELIEKYEVTDTWYTKITAKVDRDYTQRISGEITVYLLGGAENFPNREVLKAGNQYILRLEPWVHESGEIYLLNPLESTYLRIHEDMVLVRKSAALPDFHPALSPDAFAEAYDEYHKENPVDESKRQAHFDEMLTVLQNYDYANKELAYRPDATAIAKRLALAQKLAGK